jgi:hypothetical protein
MQLRKFACHSVGFFKVKKLSSESETKAISFAAILNFQFSGLRVTQNLALSAFISFIVKLLLTFRSSNQVQYIGAEFVCKKNEENKIN